MTQQCDVLILGAGAAGLMCAVEAARTGHTVTVLEHNARIGQKILISGGGRCNFTNTGARAENYVSANPHFAKSALARFTPADFIELVQRHKIQFFEKKLGQLFCQTSSREIVRLLELECSAMGVTILTNQKAVEVERNERFRVKTERGVFESSYLVVATGGLSFPKLGVTDLGYRIAERFGLKQIAPQPGLVPLLVEGVHCASLSGVSVDCVVSAGGKNFRENILFTHRGLSGPAILQISNYCAPGDNISLDLLPDWRGKGFWEKNRDGRMIPNILAEHLPRRFVETWNLASRPAAQTPVTELETILTKLHHWNLKVTGTEGYPKAEVTLGGVDTRELSSKSLEATKVPGLFFIGEIVDVTGWLGGYNFQWAWASGVAAGRTIAARSGL